MPAPRKNQKQIALKYAGNRRYFRFLNPFRRARILAALFCVILAVAGAALYLHRAQTSRGIEGLNTSGGISQAHSSIAKDCKACHDPAVALDPLKPVVATASLDANCEKCHTQHTFHAADVTVDHSCTACHHEHLGTGPMQQVADVNCQSCHSSAEIMQASAQRGSQLPTSDFQVMPKDNLLVYFQPPRPAQGYTQVFQSFENGHPAFQIQRENLSDPNTLKFNHKIHLSGDIPLVDGRKLDCAYCHKPDNRGAYMQPINFAKNCQACHSLQIDPTLPDFQIPHPEAGGQANSVRDFLLTLPTQYATYASEKKGLTDSAQIATFVNQHMLGIRERVRHGADLEKDVFFSDARTTNLGGATRSGEQDRALFPGCAYCHEVKSSATQVPIVTKPVTPDRWFVHARFDHAAHITMDCNACHGQVLHSEKTADINLPDKASCVTCHSAKGGVVSNCATCHDYHNTTPAADVATTSALRQMMLGQP
jgi:hypothetical protein